MWFASLVILDGHLKLHYSCTKWSGVNIGRNVIMKKGLQMSAVAYEKLIHCSCCCQLSVSYKLIVTRLNLCIFPSLILFP